ncbi:MAG: PAAR domain-containing protein [bacterium]
MKGIARLNDMCSGHGCWTPRSNIEGSPDVYCNNRPVHCETHSWEEHCCPVPILNPDTGETTIIMDCHNGVLEKGNPTVLVNWLQIGRCSDPIDCGSTVVTCSNDTFA